MNLRDDDRQNALKVIDDSNIPIGVDRVQARTLELTLLAGRLSTLTAQIAVELAKRDLTGEPKRDRPDVVLDPVPPRTIFGDSPPQRPAGEPSTRPEGSRYAAV